METSIPENALVIGAGLTGLACAEALSRRGIRVTILEARGRVAEPWRNRHPALKLNIHRKFARLPGLAPPRGDGPFLKRDSVVAYLESYARHIGVPIHFGAEVDAVSRDAAGWSVQTARGDYHAAHVIFATGNDRVPVRPDWPGQDGFTGEIIHSADLGDVRRFNGRKVLVVGAGNSGTDVLNHLSRHSPDRVIVSVRHGPAVVPSRVLGFPLHRLARLFEAMPSSILDPALRLTQRLLLGNLKRYGLPSHPEGGGTRLRRDGITPALDDGFIAALKAGRVHVVPEIAGFHGDRVEFTDRSSCKPDVVICATGYRTGLETLLGGLGVLDATGRPLHPTGQADPANPGLWFAGFREPFTGYFDGARIAADRIATAIAAGGQPRSRTGGPLLREPGVAAE